MTPRKPPELSLGMLSSRPSRFSRGMRQSVEDVGGGVVGADAELLLLVGDDEPRRPLLHQKRLDPGAARRPVDRRPHDHAVGAAAGGDEDLLAVDHPLVAVERGRRPHQRRIRAAARLGDRHGEDHVAPLGLLLIGAGRLQGGVAETPLLAPHAHRVVAPGLPHGDQGAHHAHGRVGIAAPAEEADEARVILGLGQLVRGELVLVLVVVAGVLAGDQRLAAHRVENLPVVGRKLEIDHRFTPRARLSSPVKRRPCLPGRPACGRCGTTSRPDARG